MALDPVCGMTVDPARAAGQVEYEGTTYYFCSKGCAAKFTADPKKYLSGTRESMAAPLLAISGLKPQQPAGEATQPVAGSAVEWVCPMDPEVVRDSPGACPKCGMALEPRVPDLG